MTKSETKIITGSMVVLTCCEGDCRCQWKTPIFKILGLRLDKAQNCKFQERNEYAMVMFSVACVCVSVMLYIIN